VKYWLLLAVAPAFGAGAALAAPSDPTRYAACIQIAAKDPARALQMAHGWRLEGGGIAARHCLAVAQMRAGHHDAALKSYEAAGQASEDAGDSQAVPLWRQAAEAAMIVDRPADALRFVDRALKRPEGTEISPRAQADLLTLRAEAQVALNQPDAAMADLTQATGLSPEFFTPWLLKATLARRSGDLPAAEASLLQAANLAPESPDVALEAGNIAAAKGDMALARQAWEAAAADGSGTPAGQAATAALGRVGPSLPEKTGSDKPLMEKPLTDGLPAAKPR
jgi:tetratricopeptide (TPR) repeat protein